MAIMLESLVSQNNCDNVTQAEVSRTSIKAIYPSVSTARGAGRRLLSTMLTKMIAAGARTRTKRNALRHWHAHTRAVLAERGRATDLLHGVAEARLATRLAPALAFWRRWAVIVRAERHQVLPTQLTVLFMCRAAVGSHRSSNA
jgi:hypothetical protein